MKTMKCLGCLLALVFAGASAFAGTWFENSVAETLGTGWSNTAGWTWTDGAGSYSNWTDPLTYTAAEQALAAKDSTITTSVKFTAMDAEDLAEQTIGDDVKGGLTVVEIAGDTPTLSYYGIVNDAGTKKWMPLTGATPTLDAFVTVTVELKNNLNSTYTITYKVGGEPLTVADASFTMATAAEATISTVEYLGQFSLASLAGNTWFNPVAIVTTGLPTGVDSVKTLVGGAEASGPFARGTTVSFAFTPGTGYAITPVAGSIELDGESASVTPTWASFVTAAAIPDGEGMPSKITVDAEEVASRVGGGAKGTTENYLFTRQDNGQLGWVNVALGIADDASGTIAATNAAPVEGVVAINFGVDVPEDVTVTYNVGESEGLTSPDIALSSTKSENIGIVDVEMVLADEGGEKHVISTAKVGVMETGKEGPTSGTTFDIVAVPWDSFGGDAISVKDLLNTAMLTAGDTLYIWNGSLYDTYTLNASGAWEAGTQTSRSSAGAMTTTSPAPEVKKIAKGTAIWIERDVSSRIVFAGLAGDASEAYQADVAAGGTEQPTWSLIANPSIKPFDLTAITGAVYGDKLIVEDAADPREYEFTADGWGYYKTVRTQVKRGSKTVWVTSQEWDDQHNVIPAGIGFWYVRSAGADAFKITFANNQ